MGAEDSGYPVVAGPEGIKLKTEEMVPDRLYHCLYDNKVFLFFKDSEGLLNCYEVEDPAAVAEITANPSQIESILERHANLKKHSQSQ